MRKERESKGDGANEKEILITKERRRRERERKILSAVRRLVAPDACLQPSFFPSSFCIHLPLLRSTWSLSLLSGFIVILSCLYLLPPPPNTIIMFKRYVFSFLSYIFSPFFVFCSQLTSQWSRPDLREGCFCSSGRPRRSRRFPASQNQWPSFSEEVCHRGCSGWKDSPGHWCRR